VAMVESDCKKFQEMHTIPFTCQECH